MRTQYLAFVCAALLMTSTSQASTAHAASDSHQHETAQAIDTHTGHDHDAKPKKKEDKTTDNHDDHAHEEASGDTTEIKARHAEKSGVTMATAQPGTIAQEIILSGQVTLNQDSTAKIRARFPGLIKAVPVKLGQTVRKGDILAKIESNESLRNYMIKAPVSGVILERNTNIGDVTGDDVLFVIADLSTLWAKFHIFPKDAHKITAGQNLRIHNIDHGKESLSQIKLLLPTADSQSQTHMAIAEISNVNDMWRPGISIDGHVTTSTTNAAVIIPKTALQNMEGQKVIFVTNGHDYEMRPVTLGKSDTDNIEIISGLKSGEKFVSHGSFVIKADIMKSGAAHVH